MRMWLFLLCSMQVFAAFNLTWGTPALSLDSNPPMGDTDSNAFIAMDPQGNALATWSRTSAQGATENIWVAAYNHSLRVWTGALKISGSGSAANSQIALDATGNAICVWEEGFPTRICYRTLSQEGVWTPDLSQEPATLISSTNAQTFPQIAIDASGNMLAAWLEFFGGMHHVMAASKSSNASWMSAGRISSGAQDALLIPAKALLLNPQGQGLVIWQEAQDRILAARYLNGAWQPSFLVADSHASSPSAGIDEAGDLIMVWEQNGMIFSKSGSLSPPLLISDPNYSAKRPHVGVDAAGNAVVVFERYNALHQFIVGASLSKGAAEWSHRIDISLPSPANAPQAGYPFFAMNAIGDGVAIWKEWTGAHTILQGAGFSLGTWSSIRTLSSLYSDAGSPTPSYDIAVALNAAGNILAIWPEDPAQTGSLQIKATAGTGLANGGPMPPVTDPISLIQGVAMGKQVVRKFPAHTDLINVLSWESPGHVDHFNIYRNTLSTLIASTKELRFEDHQRDPKAKEIYLITSVDIYGQESSPMTLVVHPK